jgi:hypothetical protein
MLLTPHNPEILSVLCLALPPASHGKCREQVIQLRNTLQDGFRQHCSAQKGPRQAVVSSSNLEGDMVILTFCMLLVAMLIAQAERLRLT